MFKLNLFLLCFVSLFYVNQPYACEVIINNFPDEIKAYEGESKIKELKGRLYVDSSLLSLQEDGIHVIYGDNDVLVPLIYHDTTGYFLSPQACEFWGYKWTCCTCNQQNSMHFDTCRVCLKPRCRQ